MTESKPRDAIALLKEDHRKVEELFKQFGPHRARREDLLSGMRR
jgi:hypothetical protein